MKTIKRTKEMTDCARYIATDKNGKIWWYHLKPVMTDILWYTEKSSSGSRLEDFKPYCKNWEKSLRKITDKPTRKELFAEIAKLNKDINNHVCPAWVGVDFSITGSKQYKDLKQQNKSLKLKIQSLKECLK